VALPAETPVVAAAEDAAAVEVADADAVEVADADAADASAAWDAWAVAGVAVAAVAGRKLESKTRRRSWTERFGFAVFIWHSRLRRRSSGFFPGLRPSARFDGVELNGVRLIGSADGTVHPTVSAAVPDRSISWFRKPGMYRCGE
jgi:hypothetical protein